MPCYMFGSADADSAAIANEELARRDAMLCAVLTVVEKHLGESVDSIFRLVNKKEAGVSGAQIRRWWKQHKKQDDVRRELERRTI